MLDEALRWTLLSAEQGNATGQVNVGSHFFEIHRNGSRDVPEELFKGWIKRGADQGLDTAQYYMGLLETDRGEAVKWFGLAAAQGHAEAIAELRDP